MDKKIILVTGASDGIGKEAARTLAKQGHRVILHGRNAQKVQQVIEEFKAEMPSVDLDSALCNLLSFADIKKMADELAKRYDHLDVLINNAGAVFSNERQLTTDGEERTFQLNVFAPFLLTKLLLPMLEKSPSARVIFEASAVHNMARKPDFEDMRSEKTYSGQGNYNLSKLYEIWMARHFSKELQGKNITVNVTHPGSVRSQFSKGTDKGFLVELIYAVWMPFADTPAEGARSEVWLATAPEMEGISGRYFSNKCKEQKPNEKYYSAEDEQRIWDYCEQACKQFLM